MENKFFGKSFFLAKTALLVLMLLFSTTFLNAQATTTTFAQYNQRTSGQDYSFANNLVNGNFQTIAGGSPVIFRYLGVAGLPVELQGDQNAHVFVTSTTTASASTNVVPGGTNRTVQPFNQTFTIRIVRDTPYLGRTNLLTATVTPIGASNPELSGDEPSNSAGFTASTSVHNVSFTSDFVSFSGTTARNLGLAFSSVNPVFSLTPGNLFVSSFTAAGAGTFAANRAPIFLVPTAANISVSGQVLTPKGRGLANARVTLTNSAGQTVTTMTDNFGNYQFSDVIAGDTVIIDVKSRLYAYPTQVVHLSEETNGLNFLPQYAKQRTR